jgi:hypothetical protein
MASTGVFVRVVFALKQSISCDPQTPQEGPREIFLRGEATHKTSRTPTKNSGKFDKMNT